MSRPLQMKSPAMVAISTTARMLGVCPMTP